MNLVPKSENPPPLSHGNHHNVVEFVMNLLLMKVLLKVWAFFSLLIIPQHYLNDDTTTTTTTRTLPKVAGKKKSPKKEPESVPDLFPSISNNENITSSMAGNIMPCSTGLTTRLLPFKNENGEIEWAFTDDMNEGDEDDEYPVRKEETLTPVTSNSSNNDSIISNRKKLASATATSDEYNHESTPTSTSSSSPFSPDSAGNKNNSGAEEDGKVHQCPHCDAVFKIRGYLTRHLKKHAVKKAYSCPFHKFSIFIDENNITHKCHPNGGFSRRDTYKTHLKSRHFKYPKGTKTKERANSPGNCSMCGEYFQNSEIWCEIHVEGGECKFLPVGFKGKSRIKNRLRKQLSKKLKDDEINDSTVNAAARAAALAFTTNGSCNIEDYDYKQHNSISSSSSSQDLPNDYNTPVFDTPTSMNSNTPMPIAFANNAPTSHGNVSSPTLSNASHPQNANNGTPGQYESPIQQLHFQQQQQVQYLQHQYQNQPPKTQQQPPQLPPQYPQLYPNNKNTSYQPPLFDQFKRHNNAPMVKRNSIDDYDDEFCLDIEQLNYGEYNVNDLLGYLKSHESDLLSLNNYLSNEIVSNNTNNHISMTKPNFPPNDTTTTNDTNVNYNDGGANYSNYVNSQIYHNHQAQAQTY